MSATPGITGRTQREVFDYIRFNAPVTKNEIVQELDLSLPTVQKYLNHFINEGWIVKGDTLPSRGGRSPRTFLMNQNGRIAVGVDITRDGVASVIVNLERKVVYKSTIEAYYERSEPYLAMVGRHVEETVTRSGVDRSRILGVGFGMPGLISRQTETVTYGGVIDNLGLSHEDFERHISFPAHLVHDVDAAALSEFWPQGAFENAVYMNISRTLGGSVLINGSLYWGDGSYAGEIGHISLHAGGLKCYCGNYGCMDPYCSTKVLARHTGGSLTAFFDALAANETTIRRVWSGYLADLARAILNVRMLFGCTVIIGGELGTHVGPYLDEIRLAVDKLSFYNPNAHEYLFTSTYTNEPVATGAALYFIDEFFSSLGNAGSRRWPTTHTTRT